MSGHRDHGGPAAQGWGRPAAIGVVSTTSVILPAFLTGAVAVQIRADLGLAESAIGLVIGAFFAGSAIGSTPLGGLAERLGPVPALRAALIAAALANLAVATLTRGLWSLAAVLFGAGLANALGQPAINLLVVRTVERRRLGLVMALKQSGMPAAALLGGLAVPAVALTVGWPAAYALGAVLALGSAASLGRVDPTPIRAQPAPATPAAPPASGPPTDPAPTEPSPAGGGAIGGAGPAQTRARPATARPDQDRRVLLVMALVGVLGGGAANIVVGYLVSGAVAAGVGPGAAGLILTGGSALGIASRLTHGWLADRGTIDPLPRVVLLFGVGVIGAVLLAIHLPVAYVVATPLVFAGGWAWPGLFNLVVVQSNRSAPAAATGQTQTGVYIGSIVGPLVAGPLIEFAGYRAAWSLVAVALIGAAATTLVVRRLIGRVEPQPPAR